MKTCNKCKEAKSLDKFGKHKLTKDGLRGECRRCALDYQNKYRKEKYSSEDYKYYCKLRQVKLNYKLNQQQYEDMIINGCEICGSFEKLCIDHDHSCCSTSRTCGNCIRGVLCKNCNHAEGHLKSNPELVLKLYKYMTRRE